MEIRRIRQTEAEAVTDLWDEAGQSVPDGGALTERGRRDIAGMLVLAASSDRAACCVDDALNGFVLAELAEDGLLPGRYGRVEELYARGDEDTERALIQAAVDWLWQRDVLVIRTSRPRRARRRAAPVARVPTRDHRFGCARTDVGSLAARSSTSNCTSSP